MQPSSFPPLQYSPDLLQHFKDHFYQLSGKAPQGMVIIFPLSPLFRIIGFWIPAHTVLCSLLFRSLLPCRSCLLCIRPLVFLLFPESLSIQATPQYTASWLSLLNRLMSPISPASLLESFIPTPIMLFNFITSELFFPVSSNSLSNISISSLSSNMRRLYDDITFCKCLPIPPHTVYSVVPQE